MFPRPIEDVRASFIFWGALGRRKPKPQDARGVGGAAEQRRRGHPPETISENGGAGPKTRAASGAPQSNGAGGTLQIMVGGGGAGPNTSAASGALRGSGGGSTIVFPSHAALYMWPTLPHLC